MDNITEAKIYFEESETDINKLITEANYSLERLQDLALNDEMKFNKEYMKMAKDKQNYIYFLEKVAMR